MRRILNWLKSWFEHNVPVPNPPHPTPVGNLESIRQQLLALHNKERTSRGIAALTRSPALDIAAQLHNDYMVANNTLTHDEPRRDVGTRVKEQGYNWMWVGENIARGQVSPEDVMKSWMNSSGHRDNILNAHYKEIGFGNSGVWWTTDFGSRA